MLHYKSSGALLRSTKPAGTRRPATMIPISSSSRGTSRSMAVQTEAVASSEAVMAAAPLTAAAAAGAAAARSGAGAGAAIGAAPGAAPRPRGGSSTQQQLGGGGGVLTTALIARATNKSVEELSMAAKSPNRVAYQGVPGAYSEMAARKACPTCEPLPCDQFEVAFQALSQWMAEWAVLPIENSLGGSIHAVYDLLLRYRLHIVGETSVAVNHCLLALPGTQLKDVTRVLSHPQALAQVDGYLRKLRVVKEAVDDTAGAAQMVAAQRLEGVAAVASRRAAELYGLEILDEGIQDFKDNVTRFIKLSRDPLVTSEADAGRPYKTSVVFSLKEGPGQLFKALSVFALRDIDMTKIESRPMRSNPILTLDGGGGGGASGGAGASTSGSGANGGAPEQQQQAQPQPAQQRFNYLFYVDFVGSLAEPRCQNALRHLQESAPFLRVLGSYPMELELGAVDSDRPVGLFDGHGSGQA